MMYHVQYKPTRRITQNEAIVLAGKVAHNIDGSPEHLSLEAAVKTFAALQREVPQVQFRIIEADEAGKVLIET